MENTATSPWYLYLLECRRGTYVGITNNLAKRYQAHATGKGARYTRQTRHQRYWARNPLPTVPLPAVLSIS